MNTALLEQLKVSPQLPTLPVIAFKALEMARKENANLSEIADLISNDPALSTKILKTVNSSFYGLPKQVSTISHALVILGMQAVKTLALGFSLVSNLKGTANDGFDYVQYWKKSIYSAVAGRLLARRINLVQQEEAFLGALLADIGVLVMHKTLGAQYDGIHSMAGGDHDKLIELCRKYLDIDHPTVGGMLAELWQLPPLLAKPIAQHHHVTETDPALRPLIEVVFTAMYVGDVYASSNPAKAIQKSREAIVERLKIPANECDKLLGDIGKATREVAALFDVQIGNNRSYQDILDEANQTLIQMTLQTQKQVQQIQKENEHLQEVASTDGLTGLANRAKFNSFVEDQFQRAYKFARPLAILFIDVDHFKKVNDTHGHQAGDEVLRKIGKLLKMAVRNIDLASRYGGEEFALVLTETESNAAAQMADEIRQAIASERVTFEGKTIPITASIGVAGTDRLRVFTTAAQLTNAADRAVYAAKQAGRNAVRLFRPKVEQPAMGKPA